MISAPLDTAAHIVQLALTPIFLLTGVASLLNVFTTRLGRIADQVDQLARASGDPGPALRRMQLRSRLLDMAAVAAAIAGALTCGAALTLFFGALRSGGGGAILFALFGGALLCAIAALGLFAGEMLIAGRAVRQQAEGKRC